MSKELEALNIQANFINAFRELLSKTDHNVIQINITRNMAQEIVNLYEQHKNLKPSEALKDLEIVSEFLGLNYARELNTIKQALLKAQEQEKENPILKACISDWEDDYEHLEYALHKEKEILKIIKEKRVKIDLLYASSSVEQYNDELVIVYGMWFVKDRQLAQDEFDTLKRWLYD